MEDGRDRARRSTGPGGESGRRRARDEEYADDVLARHGLGASEPAGRAGRRRAAEYDEPPARRAPAGRPSAGAPEPGRRRRAEPDDNWADDPADGPADAPRSGRRAAPDTARDQGYGGERPSGAARPSRRADPGVPGTRSGRHGNPDAGGGAPEATRAVRRPDGRGPDAPAAAGDRFGAAPDATRATRRSPEATGTRRAAAEPGGAARRPDAEARGATARQVDGRLGAAPEPTRRPDADRLNGRDERSGNPQRGAGGPAGDAEPPARRARSHAAEEASASGRFGTAPEATRATPRPAAGAPAGRPESRHSDEPGAGARRSARESASGRFGAAPEATHTARRPDNGTPPSRHTGEPGSTPAGVREPAGGRFGAAPEATRATRRPDTDVPDGPAARRTREPADGRFGAAPEATRASRRPDPEAPGGRAAGRHTGEPASGRFGAVPEATRATRRPDTDAPEGRAAGRHSGAPAGGAQRSPRDPAGARIGAAPEATRATRRPDADAPGGPGSRHTAEPPGTPRSSTRESASGRFGAAPEATRATRRPGTEAPDGRAASRHTAEPTGGSPRESASGRFGATPEATRRPDPDAPGSRAASRHTAEPPRNSTREPAGGRFGAAPEPTRASRRPDADALDGRRATEAPGPARRSAPAATGSRSGPPEATRATRRPDLDPPGRRAAGRAAEDSAAGGRFGATPDADAPNGRPSRHSGEISASGRHGAAPEATRATRRPPADEPGGHAGRHSGEISTSGRHGATPEGRAAAAGRRAAPGAAETSSRHGAPPEATRAIRRPGPEAPNGRPSRHSGEISASGRHGAAPDAPDARAGGARRGAPAGVGGSFAVPAAPTGRPGPDAPNGRPGAAPEATRATRRPEIDTPGRRAAPEPTGGRSGPAKAPPTRRSTEEPDERSAARQPGASNGSGRFGAAPEATRAIRRPQAPGGAGRAAEAEATQVVRRPEPDAPAGRAGGRRPAEPAGGARPDTEATRAVRRPGAAPDPEAASAEATRAVRVPRRPPPGPADPEATRAVRRPGGEPRAGGPPEAAATTKVRAVPPGRGRPDDDEEPLDPAGLTMRVQAQPRDGAGPDRSERAELALRAEREQDPSLRAERIDETLTRLTAAHAGLALAARDDADQDEPPPPRRRIRLTPGRIVAGALALVVLLTTTFGWGTKGWLEAAVRDAAALDLESSAIVDAATQTGDENVLVVGSEPSAAATVTTPRADTVAVAHIPAGGGPVTVVSFPNDLEINRPPCERWDAASASYLDETEPAEARTDLMSALDRGGPRCLTRVVQQLSGLAITKYVGMDIEAVRALTDAVGGADVCVPRPVLDGVLGPVVPDAGENRIEGVRAADFVRAGDVPGDPSPDYGRVERQQQVLAAVLEQAVSDTALLDVGRLAALRSALGEAVVADGANIDELLALSLTLRRLDAEGVTFATVPVGEPNNRGNTVMRETEAADLFAAVRTDGPLPDQAGAQAADAGPAPGDVTVEVFNASDRSGLAGEVGETLRSLGFGVGEIASAEQPTAQTVIRFSPDQAAAAALLAATVPSATSVPDPGASGVLQLVLGRSFDDVVRAPSEPVALQATTTAPVAQVPPTACS